MERSQKGACYGSKLDSSPFPDVKRVYFLQKPWTWVTSRPMLVAIKNRMRQTPSRLKRKTDANSGVNLKTFTTANLKPLCRQRVKSLRIIPLQFMDWNHPQAIHSFVLTSPISNTSYLEKVVTSPEPDPVMVRMYIERILMKFCNSDCNCVLYWTHPLPLLYCYYTFELEFPISHNHFSLHFAGYRNSREVKVRAEIGVCCLCRG